MSCTKSDVETEYHTTYSDRFNVDTLIFFENALEASHKYEDEIFHLEVFLKDGIAFSNFRIYNLEGIEIYRSDFEVDRTAKHYKLQISKGVINAANTPSPIDSLLDNDRYSNHYNNFLINIVKSYNRPVTDPLIEPLFIHHSILEYRVRRITQGLDNCACTTHPGYLTDETGFSCQEDIYLSKEVILETISKNKSSFADNSSLSLKIFLEAYDEEYIRYDKFYSFYIPKEDYLLMLELIEIENTLNSTSRACGWYCLNGCGSDWGCCGNYSGCCILWSPGVGFMMRYVLIAPIRLFA